MDGVVHSDESFNDTFIGERDFDNAAAGTKTRYVDIVTGCFVGVPESAEAALMEVT